MSLNNTNEIDFGLTQMSIVARKMQLALDHYLQPLDLNASNYYFMLKINPVSGTTQDQLYREIHLDQSNITRRLTRLEELGLISKERSEVDRRAWQVKLTTMGRERLGPLRDSIDAANEQVFANLDGKQQDELFRLLTIVGENLA